jgi:Tfp pilus assembly protein PilF
VGDWLRPYQKDKEFDLKAYSFLQRVGFFILASFKRRKVMMKKKITVSTLAFVSSANLGAVAEKCRQHRSLTMLVLLGCFLMLSACAPAKLTPVKKQKLDQAIQQDPSALNYWIRATAYRDVGQYWRAIEDYTRSIELDSSNPKVFNGRGVCYVKLGLHDQSIEDYSHAIEELL